MRTALLQGGQGLALLQWNAFFKQSFAEIESEVNDFRIWAVVSHEAGLSIHGSIYPVEYSQRQKGGEWQGH